MLSDAADSASAISSQQPKACMKPPKTKFSTQASLESNVSKTQSPAWCAAWLALRVVPFASWGLTVGNQQQHVLTSVERTVLSWLDKVSGIENSFTSSKSSQKYRMPDHERLECPEVFMNNATDLGLLQDQRGWLRHTNQAGRHAPHRF